MKVLFVNGCIRGEESRTLRLCRVALEQMEKTLGELTVEELNLDKEAILPLHSDTLRQRDELSRAGAFDHPMFQYARQFAQADVILIGAPYWEFQFPALMRCYIEHIAVGGVTFRYTEEGRPEGLCKAQRVFYVTTAGGPILDRNCGFDYLKILFQDMLTIPQVEYVAAETLDVWGVNVEAQLKAAEYQIREKIGNWK